jgi:hypothetical protein
VLTTLLAAVDGRFPDVDGIVEFVSEPAPGQAVVMAFTGHALIATPQPATDFDDLRPDGYGGAVHPAVLLRLAGAHGVVGVLDVTLAARGRGGASLPLRLDLDDHPRVRHARTIRTEVRVFGDERGLVTVASGLAGRRELSVEVTDGRPGQGSGRGLVTDALALVPAGEPVFAAVAPGNARSLRAFLAVGFRPIGSEVIIHGRNQILT